MSKIITVVPSGHNVGLTSASLGLLRALEKTGHKVGFVKPIAQPLRNDAGPERSTSLARSLCNIESPAPITLAEAQHLLSTGNEAILLENVVEMIQPLTLKFDVVVVEGLVSSSDIYYSKNFNQLLVKALDAEIVFVAAPNGRTPHELAEAIEIEYREYTKDSEAGTVVCGCIINKVSQSEEDTECTQGSIARTKARDYGIFKAEGNIEQLMLSYKTAVSEKGIEVLAVIPVLTDLIAPRAADFATLLEAHALRAGDGLNRRVKSVALISMTLNKSVYYFQDGALIVTTGDRVDNIVGACMAALNGVKLAGVLLCGGFEPDASILRMCERAFVEGLPLYSLPSSSYETALKISRTKIEIPLDDKEQANRIVDTVAGYMDQRWLTAIIKTQREHRISPPEFRSLLIRLAKDANKRIVLPEGDEPRTVRAAVTYLERGIARPVLLGSYEAIMEVAARQEIILPADIEIIDPAAIRSKYITQLCDLRKSKGMTPDQAARELEDNVMLGTMMLKLGEVDGLVSGAVHTTANTIRPALQIIKMTPDSNLVSSIFFMCLPNQVLVFGDCAINPNPTAEELADIAIQSYDSAVAFRITPRMGMISYSTGASGAGSDVEKVRAATDLIRSRRPDIVVDGPLQYDAATTESVARSKAPNSPVAGRATVLIFPDLNTGNTTYKAVQRSAGVISIGPMLQGLAKPVNDLSRGALVEDIVYTIALTAIQAVQMEQKAAISRKS